MLTEKNMVFGPFITKEYLKNKVCLQATIQLGAGSTSKMERLKG